MSLWTFVRVSIFCSRDWAREVEVSAVDWAVRRSLSRRVILERRVVVSSVESCSVEEGWEMESLRVESSVRMESAEDSAVVARCSSSLIVASWVEMFDWERLYWLRRLDSSSSRDSMVDVFAAS